MAVTIGSNIPSLRIKRTLDSTSSGLSKVFERLASGQRINSAADDAAGLSIASKLNADGRVFSMAVRNVSDGISYLSIAEGAIGALKDITIRMRELSTQASNGTLGDTQRASLNNEFQSLMQEYNRVLETTSFNGTQVFLSNNSTVTIQAGYGAAGALSFSFLSSSANALNTISAISVTASGVVSNGASSPNVTASGSNGMSVDGRYVVFASNATNLVAGVADGLSHIFLRDRLTGTTSIVDTDQNGVLANQTGSNAVVSGNGRYVAFQTSASNLISGDTNGTNDIYVKDMVTGSIVRANVSSTGAQDSNVLASSARISDDGRYVFFTTGGSSFGYGGSSLVTQIYRKDLQTGAVVMASSDSSGTIGNAASTFASASGDGRYVAFASNATNLIPGGVAGIYRKDLETGAVSLMSATAGGVGADNTSGNPSISQNGRYVVFHTAATNLAANDTNGLVDVYMKDAETGAITLISQMNGVVGAAASQRASVSGDGRFVVFHSAAQNFNPGDPSGLLDVYIKDTMTGNLTALSLNAQGTFGDNASAFPVISADGSYIAFFSNASNLVSGDTNAASDVFVVTNPGYSEYSTTRMQWMRVDSRADALISQTYLDNYLQELSDIQSQIGASLSRLDVAAATSQVAALTSKQAESRIMDADIAQESAELTRRRILQDAGAALLGQANQAPAIALNLLRNV